MRKETTVILIVIIAMASFFGFYPLFAEFKEPAAQAFGAAIFGTIFTIVLTMFLLKTQTEVSQSSERSQMVFQEKLKLFNKTIEILGRCFKDGKISKDERPELELILMRLTMLAKEKTLLVFRDLYDDIFEDTEPEEEIQITQEQKNKLLTFAIACRYELDLDELSGKGTKFQEQKAVQLQENLSPTLAAMGTEKRITYSGWDEFEKFQSANSKRKPFIPIAKAVHNLIIKTLDGAKLKPEIDYEINYGGGGTFSFKLPKDKDIAKDKKRVFARFGLLNSVRKKSYLQSLYKNAEKEQVEYPFESIEDFNKVSKDIELAVLTSYKLLAK